MSDKYQLNSTNLQFLDYDFYIEISQKLSRIHDVEKDLEDFTADYSYFHGLMIRAKHLLDREVNKLETMRAIIKTEKRKEAKRTVEALNDEVTSMSDISDLSLKVVELEKVYGYAKALCSTLDHKKDMLVQLSANRRMETKLHA